MLLVRSCVFVVPFADFPRDVRALVCIGSTCHAFLQPRTASNDDARRTHAHFLGAGPPWARRAGAGGRVAASVRIAYLARSFSCLLPLQSRTIGGTYAAPQHHIA